MGLDHQIGGMSPYLENEESGESNRGECGEKESDVFLKALQSPSEKKSELLEILTRILQLLCFELNVGTCDKHFSA